MRVRNIGRAAVVVGVLATGLAGCNRSGAEPVAEPMLSPEGLAATMGVETGHDVVRLTLHVTNTSGAPIELQFTSGQRYDFQVVEVDDAGQVGETVWTWSADKSFMQAVGVETLEPGRSLTFTEEWASAGVRGDLLGRGTLTSTSHPVAQSVRFELTGDE